jgi:hypothetical protein
MVMRPSPDAIEVPLCDAPAGAIARICPFAAIRRCARVLASGQRYDTIVAPGGPGRR